MTHFSKVFANKFTSSFISVLVFTLMCFTCRGRRISLFPSSSNDSIRLVAVYVMSPLPLVVSSIWCKCHLMKSSRHESSFFTYSSPSYPVSWIIRLQVTFFLLLMQCYFLFLLPLTFVLMFSDVHLSNGRTSQLHPL